MTSGGARQAGTAGRRSRWSASFAVAVAMHAAVLALVRGSAIVRLDVMPVKIDLAFLEASDRSAGPGETAAELRVASPPPVAPPEPAHREPPPEPAPKEAEPVTRLAPERVVKPASPPREELEPPTAARKPAEAGALPSTSNADSEGGAGASHMARGGDVRSTAPAWAAAARVRYEQLLFAWMDRHKQYPLLAQRRGLEGAGSVRVRIGRDGRVLERALVQTTGEHLLDQAALDMVRRASPFPAVPAEYSGDTFEFVAPIQYRLH